MPRWINLANLFTLGRLAAVPFAVHDILEGNHGRALAIVLLAGLSDTIDGTLARRFGMATAVGAYLDPIVDKFFLSAVYICLALKANVPWWLVIEIFTRDFLILTCSGILLLMNRRRGFPPSVWGKASTFLQIGCALAIMVDNAYSGSLSQTARYAFFIPVAALTAFSGLHYLWHGLLALRKEEVATQPAIPAVR